MLDEKGEFYLGFQNTNSAGSFYVKWQCIPKFWCRTGNSRNGHLVWLLNYKADNQVKAHH